MKVEEQKKDEILAGDIKKEISLEEVKDKKIKNLISLSILLGGLFVGSLFVDIAQIVRGGGFSQKILNESDVFSLDGKTWVAYQEPLIKLQILTDDTCENCSPEEAIIGLKRELPTILTEKVDVKSENGKKLIEKFGIKSIPAFVFGKDIEKAALFAQAQSVFEQKDDQYLLNSAAVGLPVGKYMETPKIKDGDLIIGNKDAKVKVIEYSDFQCPYCKQMHETIVAPMLKEYGDKIAYVYRHLPLNFHAQAQNAALASECANEQGKFSAYADKLFATQEEWGGKEGTINFKNYARQLGLNSTQFNQCVDSNKYADKIAADAREAQELGISGTPGTFLNDQFTNGAISSYETFKKSIDAELSK